MTGLQMATEKTIEVGNTVAKNVIESNSLGNLREGTLIWSVYFRE